MKLPTGSSFMYLLVYVCLGLSGQAAAGTYEAPLDVRKDATAKFEAEPTAAKKDGKVEISFTVSAPIDVEVSVLDAKGTIVRHLASGLLGRNAPKPFKKDALKQELEWDLRDDDGRPATGGPFKVRVRLGLGSEMDRFIPGEVPKTPPPTAIGVGPDGTVYVLSSRGKAGGAYLFALDRNGKYLRTILPPPAGLKKEQVKGLNRVKLADGSEVPVIYNAYMADTAPYLAGFRSQQLTVTSKGWIVMASGGNNWSDQSVPRHALVIKPDGTTPPEVGFVGPKLERHSRYSIGLRPQQLAASPDGETMYFVGLGVGANRKRKRPAKGVHTVARFTWKSGKGPEPFIGKPDEPGSGPAQLNDPISVATDAKGNIYVADFGNNRVAIFDAAGKPLGQVKVERPRQICVHPSGAMYVLTQPRAQGRGRKRWGPCAIVKFGETVGGKEVARLSMTGLSPVMALDPSSEKPRLWLANSVRYRAPRTLLAIEDQGDKLVAGKDVLAGQGGGGFTSPLYIAADPGNDRLYVGDFSRKVLKVDVGKGDAISRFLTASEVAVDRDGNVYALMGYGTNSLERFSADGKKSPFPGTGSNKISVLYRAGLPHVGVRGLTVAPGGDIYVFEEKLKPEQLHVFGPDGKLKKKSVIKDMPVDSGNGIAVDRAGNIYAGICVHTPKHLYPKELEGQVPPLAWYMLYTKKSSWYNLPGRDIPAAPWKYSYLNFYLYHYGSVFKFSPKGGTFWTAGAPAKGGKNPRPAGAPADAVEYRHGYFRKVVWGSGAEWRYRGFGINVNRTESWGDPACSCYNGRFGIDEHDRLFVPDAFRFTVTVLDTAGNEIARIGTYGNVDAPAEKIPLASPNAVASMKDTAYIIDRKNRRIAVVKLKFAAEASCAIK
jgi:sugar lactone lactonase YvrE